MEHRKKSRREVEREKEEREREREGWGEAGKEREVKKVRAEI